MEEVMKTAMSIVKALLAGAIAFVGAVAVGYTDEVITTAEWWASAASGLTAFGVVWGVPNRASNP